ncbi:SIMPL domain-containing protein [Acetobacter sp.]|jgi:uncharacterized protein YggE|uniref:SIMPL domain-containing protein n=1 Tax=Acetobacter sp. TaxID=440 RepID=UPI0025C6C1C1|nr:SIMPL domain-containing protein [Acetobacter sp.]MCH4089859.1 SIMPL domain-containing protein [Acetobacter sp.]MCI1298555.1 SIMPL domain-containing protein [Acetobacter sp.]MCI1315120.1 SIMPL domain-containing protein [Acetobacter sp.]
MIQSKSLYLATCGVAFLGSISSGAVYAAAPADSDASTRLNVTGSGSVDAAPDLVTATLLVQNEAAKAVEAQAKTNDAARNAVTRAEKVVGVTVLTDSYDVSENRKDNKPSSWTARQTIQIKAKDASALLDLVGKLQASGLLLEGVSWSLSPEHQKELHRQAEKKAVEDMRNRSNDIAGDLGLKVSSIASISVDESLMVRPVAFMARAAMAAPTMRSEDQTVSATIRAEVILKPR